MADRLSFLLACSVSLLIIVLSGTVRVYSQGTLCYITSTQVVPGEGDTVSAGQLVRFQITLTGSCPTPGTYSIRADLINPATSQVISTARGQLQANGQFIATLTESALAPPSLGRWVLQISVYVLMDGSVIAPASQETFGLTVIPYVASSTVAMTQTTVIESTSETSPLIQSTITQPSVTIFSTISSQSQMVAPTSGGFYTEVQLAAAAVLILVVLVAFLARRRKQAKTEETRVY